MASVNLTDLKARFASGDTPSAKDYIDLIDTLAGAAAGSITGAMLANQAVDSAQLKDSAVIAAKILDGTITPVKMNNGGLINKYLQLDGSGTVGWSDLGAPATSIGNRSVTQAKMAFGSDFWAADSGTANAVAVAFTPSMVGTPPTGTVLFIKKANSVNSGATTLAVDGGSAIAIKKNNAAALVAGDLPANVNFAVAFDGTVWNLIGYLPDVPIPIATGRTFSEAGVDTSTNLGNSDTLIATATLTLPAGKTWKWIKVVFTTTVEADGANSAAVNSVTLKIVSDAMSSWADSLLPSGLALPATPVVKGQFFYITEGDPTGHANDASLVVNLYANKNGSTNGDNKAQRKWYVVGEYF